MLFLGCLLLDQDRHASFRIVADISMVSKAAKGPATDMSQKKALPASLMIYVSIGSPQQYLGISCPVLTADSHRCMG